MSTPADITGMVFDVKRFALHDGPGIRTTVFLKGCPLSCVWCHNPESIRPGPELFWSETACTGCRTCRNLCEHKAVEFTGAARIYHADRCVMCGRCARACPAGAITLIGMEMTAEQALEIVERDKPFYDSSGGGVTISGGEPLAQKDFTARIFRGARSCGIHTCLDTSGHGPWGHLEELLGWTDMVLLDIKLVDSERHKALTGATNETILDNARRLAASGVELVVRVPIIPGRNDSPPDVAALAEFLKTLDGVRRIELLPYNRLAESKYARVGLTYELAGLETPDEAHILRIENALATGGQDVKTVWGLT